MTPPAHYPRVCRISAFNSQRKEQDTSRLAEGEACSAMTPSSADRRLPLEGPASHKDQSSRGGSRHQQSSFCILFGTIPSRCARLYRSGGLLCLRSSMFRSNTITVDSGGTCICGGTEFSGEARIHWFFISFTVGFGKGAPTELTPIPGTSSRRRSYPRRPVLRIAVQQGLIRRLKMKFRSAGS